MQGRIHQECRENIRNLRINGNEKAFQRKMKVETYNRPHTRFAKLHVGYMRPTSRASSARKPRGTVNPYTQNILIGHD